MGKEEEKVKCALSKSNEGTDLSELRLPFLIPSL